MNPDHKLEVELYKRHIKNFNILIMDNLDGAFKNIITVLFDCV